MARIPPPTPPRKHGGGSKKAKRRTTETAREESSSVRAAHEPRLQRSHERAPMDASPALTPSPSLGERGEQELPAGWKWVKLGDVLTSIKSGYPTGDHNTEGRGFLHFRPYNITDKGVVDLHLRKFVPLKSEDYFLAAGDIVFNNTNSPELLGKTCYIENSEKWVYSNHMTRIRLNADCDTKFVATYMHYMYYRGFYREHCSNHVNQASVAAGLLQNIVQIPLPPLAEQHAIVAKIEQLFSELDKGVESIKRAQQQLKTYRQAVLKAAFEGRLVGAQDFVPQQAEQLPQRRPDGESPALTPSPSLGERGEQELPAGWRWVKLGEIAEKLDQGWSPKCENEPSTDINQWAVIKTTAVQAGEFLEFENKILPKKLKPRDQHELRSGDILITRAGPRVRVGVCCLVRKTRPKLLNCDKVYRIRIKPDLATPECVELILNTPTFVSRIEELKTGINDSGVNLTQTAFLSLEIPLPPLAEQQAIVAAIESRLSVADQLEATLAQSLAQAESLRQAVLKKAFEGRLV